jgi:hypothetical protein
MTKHGVFSLAKDYLATNVARNYKESKSFGLGQDWRSTYFWCKSFQLRKGSDELLATHIASNYATSKCVSILEYKATH